MPLKTFKHYSPLLSRSSLCAAAILSLSALTIHASPTVDGMNILMPNDGWYQVQDGETFTEVCAGLRSCEVSAGNYIVINHTTGERFENVVVTGGEITETNTVVLDSNRISWPDDGWYQVQNADTFESICEGGRSCVIIDDGTYTVINHSTGERFENIVIGDEQTPPVVGDLRFERYSSSAVELFWSHPISGEPAEGYALTQNGVFLRNVTGTSLYLGDLPDSTRYQFAVSVVGETATNSIIVPRFDHAPTGGAIEPIISVENHALLLREITQIANDDTLNAASDSLTAVFDVVEVLIEQAIVNGTSVGNGLTFVSRTFVNEGGEYSDYAFSCSSGGTLVAYAYRDDGIVGGPYIYSLEAEGACSINDAAYEGTAYKAVRFVRSSDVSTFENFSMSQADGDSLLLDGDYLDSSPENRGPVVVTRWTDANLHVVDDGETTQVVNYTSNRRSVVPSVIPDSPTVGATADVRFTVTAPWSGGQPLDVLINLVYESTEELLRNDTGGYNAQWQSGAVRVTAADGSGLTLSPGTDDVATVAVNIDGEDTPIIYNWADGFQIDCASGFNCP